MPESTLAIISFLKIVFIAIFSLFYSLGGTEINGKGRKWIRRYIGPLWMLGGVVLFGKLQGVFEWWHLLYPILLSAALHIGYGGTDDTIIKIRKRAIYGLAIGVSSLPLLFNSHLWVLYGVHVFLCVSMSVLLGVINPTRSARDEESLIAAFSSVLPLFLIA